MVDTIPKLYESIQNKGFNVSKSATISFRPKGSHFFYLSSKRKPEQTCTIDLNLEKNIYSQNIFCEMNEQDIHDLNMHGKIHLSADANEDLYVVHLHGPRNILSYSCLLHHVELSSIRRYFPELDADFRIAENLDYTFEYERESDGLKLAADVQSRMIDHNIVVLANHGIVATGDTPEKVVDMIDEIEYYCGIAIHDEVRIYHS